MREIQYRDAINEAIAEEMELDPTIVIMGEEVAQYDGAYKVTKGLLDRFGPKRVLDTPIAENGFVGLGVGAAMCGLRPIVEVMTFNFAFVAFDQIINNAAKLRYMSGGQIKVPMVIRGPGGPANWLAAQHSHSVESMFAHIPGLVVVQPATPYLAKGLLKAAIRNDNPVIFIESEVLYGTTGPVPEETYVLEIGKGDLIREGKDVTIIANAKMRFVAEKAAERLAAEHGIDAEVIDPVTLRPLDEEMILKSVAKTHRCVIVEETWPYCGIGAQFAYTIQHQLFDELDAPIERVTQADTPIPYANNLQRLSMPDPDRVIAAVKKVCYV